MSAIDIPAEVIIELAPHLAAILAKYPDTTNLVARVKDGQLDVRDGSYSYGTKRWSTDA